MIDRRDAAYLDRVLKMDPSEQTSEYLSTRNAYLNPHTAVVAELLDECESSPQDQARSELAILREQFWTLDHFTLNRRLAALSECQFSKIALAASRLNKVAHAIPELRNLFNDPECHRAFSRTVCEVVVATSGEAAKLRLDQLRYMTHGTAETTHSAISAIKRSALAIKYRFPLLYELERDWIEELLAYRPISSNDDDTSNTILGICLIGLAIATLNGLIWGTYLLW